MLCGCRTVRSQKGVDGFQLAAALADYVALENHLPAGVEALRSYDHKRHPISWRNISECSFKAVSTNAVRVTWTDTSGTEDYRIVVIYARHLPALPIGSNTNACADMLTDSKVVFSLYH